MKKHTIIFYIVIFSLLGTNELNSQMIGEVRIFAGNFAPRGWAFCDGSLLPISQNTALFSILGTTYGGDGRTTFALPNIQSRIVIGEGNGPGLSNYRLGQLGGSETNTHTINTTPSHNHPLTIRVNTSAGEESGAKGIFSAHDNGFSSEAANGTLGGASTTNAGQNQPVNNMQPYIVVRYIIALTGTYPSRS